MRMQYAISLWNFSHYRDRSLERAVAEIREQGYGIELWGSWAEESDMYDEVGRKRYKPLVEGMSVSMHTAGAGTMERMKKHIDTAAYVGAKVIVLHPDDVARHDDPDKPDFERARRAVDYADRNGVRLAPSTFLL